MTTRWSRPTKTQSFYVYAPSDFRARDGSSRRIGHHRYGGVFAANLAGVPTRFKKGCPLLLRRYCRLNPSSAVPQSLSRQELQEWQEPYTDATVRAPRLGRFANGIFTGS